MISQTLISFKIDSSSLDVIDSIISLYSTSEKKLNRNKIINYSLRFALDVIRLQASISRKYPNFLSEIK